AGAQVTISRRHGIMRTGAHQRPSNGTEPAFGRCCDRPPGRRSGERTRGRRLPHDRPQSRLAILRRKRMKTLVSLLGGIAAALVAASASAVITLGASVQLSGPLANTGRYYRDGYEMAIDTINKAGGVKVGG